MTTAPTGRRHLLFVYGTLRQGRPLHDVLADNAWPLGLAHALGYSLWSNTGYFPFLAAHIGGRVIGELYAVDEATLERCDDIEHSAGYSTVTIEVIDERGSRLPAYAYLGHDEWRKTAAFVGEEWQEGW